MNCSPTLTAEDFKNVHNAKCELYSVLQNLEGVVHPQITKRLQNAMDLLNAGLSSAYDQDEVAYEAAQAHIDEVEEELGGLDAIWSMHEIKDLRAPHPWPRADIVTYQGYDSVGEVKVRIEGPRWADLWVAADKAISLSRDHHHIFIEDFTPSKTRENELCLSTGS